VVGGWSGRSRVKPKTGYTALSSFGWTVAAMSEAIAKRVADTGQATRAASEWSHRWQTKRLRNEAGGWLLFTARGWRVFLFFDWIPLKINYGQTGKYKNHDSPAAGGDQQASQLWAANGLKAAETNVAGMKRKVLSLRSPEV